MKSEVFLYNKRLVKGTVLNRKYEIEDVLGDGGFSITYQVVHKNMRNRLAIKEFYCREYMYRDVRISNEVQLIDPSEESRRERDLKNFLNEARILADLSSVNGIVRVTDFFEENATAYIVMEIVEGVSLEKQLQSGLQYAWDDVLRKFLPIAEALTAVHKKGMIHRDIKPDNLLVTQDGSLVLIDFGAALHFSNEETHSVYLSEGYAPKEQYLRSGRLGAYTDVYALCATMYRCLTGKIPEHSVQRVVFDELKKPSEMGIQLPYAFEAILMKGLAVEPESRWQDMEEFSQALKNLLPKPPKTRKILYSLMGLVAAFAVMAGAYLFTHYSELKIRQLASKGETVEFCLQAPEGMTADEFAKAVKIVEDRANTFAGKKGYLLEQNLTNVYFTIPRTKFAVADQTDDPWTLEEILYILFSFSGRWYLHNSDHSEFRVLTPENIVNVELKYGSIPIVSSSGEPYLFTGPTDWSKIENYYFIIEFDDETALYLSEFLSQEGFEFVPIPHVNDAVFARSWVSKGDGKTAYYPIGPSSCKAIAETMLRILSADAFSDSFEVTWEEGDNVTWETASNKNGLQQNVDEIDETTVELFYKMESEKEAETIKEFCKKQLNTIEVPYAIGQNQSSVHVRLPSARINELVACSLFGAYTSITAKWGESIFTSSDLNAEVLLSGNSNVMGISVDSLAIYDQQQFGDPTSFDSLYLYIGGIRIGILDSADWDAGYFKFNILLPETGKDVIEPQKMMTYICSAINQSNISPGFIDGKIWRDEKGRLLSYKEIPNLPNGVDEERFTPLFSLVRSLGGKAKYVPDSNEEYITISFENWNGSFPEDALKMIEDLYTDGGIGNYLCSRIDITVKTWYRGEAAAMRALFAIEEKSQSVICIYGSVTVNDSSILEKAEQYVKASTILTPSEDRFIGESIWYYDVDGWNYEKNADFD